MARGIVIDISADPESATRALAMVREQMAQTAESGKAAGDQLSESMHVVKDSLESIGVWMGAHEAIKGIREMIGGSLELGEALSQARQQTGLSVETLSTLHYAAAITGQDFEALTRALGRMDRAIGMAADGNKQDAALMKSLGLNAKDLAGRTDGAEIAFQKFVQTLAATEDPIRRVQLAQQLLGRAGAEQVPVLLEIAAHWDELTARAAAAGVQLNSETAAALEATNQSLEDMKLRIQGVGMQLTEGMIPALNQTVSSMSNASVASSEWQETGTGLGYVVKGLATAWDVLAVAIRATTDVLTGGQMAEISAIEAIGDAQTHQWAKMVENIKDAKNDLTAAFQEASEDGKRFHDEMSSLWGRAPVAKQPIVPTAGTKPFQGDPASAAKHAKSDDGIYRAGAALAEQQAESAESARKAIDEQELAALEAKHKEVLLSDAAFYKQKLAAQQDELDAEQKTLEDKQAALKALLVKQQNDPKLARNKNIENNQSAQEIETKRELLAVGEQLNAVKTKGAQLQDAYDAQAVTEAQAADLANLRAAAELEKERNSGITAQIALLQKEAAIKVQQSANRGESAAAQAEIRDMEQIAEQKLNIGEVTREITGIEQQYKQAIEEVNDAAKKDPRLKKSAAQAVNQLQKEEYAQLQALVQQYDALAATLGGPYLEAAKKLRTELAELQVPNNKSGAKQSQEFASGIESMINRLTEATVRGKESFHKMAQGIEQDLIQLALKMAEEKWLTPALEGTGGSGAGKSGGGGFMNGLDSLLTHLPHFADGGDPTGPSVVGERGPEIWTPPRKGGSITPNNVLTKLAETGGGGRAPNVTTNIINQTSQPVQAQPSQVSYDSDLKQFVIHTVLENQSQGGAIAQANQQPS